MEFRTQVRISALPRELACCLLAVGCGRTPNEKHLLRKRMQALDAMFSLPVCLGCIFGAGQRHFALAEPLPNIGGYFPSRCNVLVVWAFFIQQVSSLLSGSTIRWRYYLQRVSSLVLFKRRVYATMLLRFSHLPCRFPPQTSGVWQPEDFKSYDPARLFCFSSSL